jgi:hypothetical protein
MPGRRHPARARIQRLQEQERNITSDAILTASSRIDAPPVTAA